MSGMLDLLLRLGGQLSETEEQHWESFIPSLQRCLFTKENFPSSDLLNQLSAGGAAGPGHSGRWKDAKEECGAECAQVGDDGRIRQKYFYQTQSPGG